MPRTARTEPPYLQFELATVEDCSFCKFLTVTLVETVANAKGHVRTQTSRIFDKLQVSEDDLPLIREAGIDVHATGAASNDTVSDPVTE